MGLFIGIHVGLTLAFGWIGDVIIAYLIYLLLKHFARLTIFPGSYWFVLRSMEYEKGLAMAVRGSEACSNLKYIFQKLANEELDGELKPTDVSLVCSFLNSYHWVLGIMAHRKTINSS